MGRRQFWRWVTQINKEIDARTTEAQSWRGSENDPGWQAMRDRRDKWRGR